MMQERAEVLSAGHECGGSDEGERGVTFAEVSFAAAARQGLSHVRARHQPNHHVAGSQLFSQLLRCIICWRLLV